MQALLILGLWLITVTPIMLLANRAGRIAGEKDDERNKDCCDDCMSRLDYLSDYIDSIACYSTLRISRSRFSYRPEKEPVSQVKWCDIGQHAFPGNQDGATTLAVEQMTRNQWGGSQPTNI